MGASYYRRAHKVSEDYYPGINLATLAFLIEQLESKEDASSLRPRMPEAYAELAEKIRDELMQDLGANVPNGDSDKQIEPEDIHWRLATVGEACLLLLDSNAGLYYRRAWEHPNTRWHHAHDSIRKQAERIMRRQEEMGPTHRMRQIHDELRTLFES
jgi:hypothetical protein